MERMALMNDSVRNKPVPSGTVAVSRRYQQAIDSMRNDEFFRHPKYTEQQTFAYTVGADPLICEFAGKVVLAAAKLGIPLYAHCIVRTAEEQASAYARGVSRVNPLTTPWPHRAFAVDIIHSTRGWMDKPVIPHAWDVIGHLGFNVAKSMQIEVNWGGEFKTLYDPAHFELADWKERYAKRFP